MAKRTSRTARARAARRAALTTTPPTVTPTTPPTVTPTTQNTVLITWGLGIAALILLIAFAALFIRRVDTTTITGQLDAQEKQIAAQQTQIAMLQWTPTPAPKPTDGPTLAPAAVITTTTPAASTPVPAATATGTPVPAATATITTTVVPTIQVVTLGSFTAKDVTKVLGDGNWTCFFDRTDGVAVKNWPNGTKVAWPLSAVDKGIKYTLGEVVPGTGAATAWLGGTLPRSECPNPTTSDSIPTTVCTSADLATYGSITVTDSANGTAIVIATKAFVVPNGWTVDMEGKKFQSGNTVPAGKATWWAPESCKPLK